MKTDKKKPERIIKIQKYIKILKILNSVDIR